tara:strand:- start:2327 stop:2686 length:360 start_codon:yes stop_codon:yes gene_type:complete
MYEAMWFLGGAALYQLFSALLRYSQLALFAQELIVSCLSLLAKLHEDAAFIQQLKHKMLHDSDISEDKMKLIKEADERSLRNWRISVISHFLMTFPRSFRGLVKFSNWRQAMAYLQNEK